MGTVALIRLFHKKVKDHKSAVLSLRKCNVLACIVSNAGREMAERKLEGLIQCFKKKKRNKNTHRHAGNKTLVSVKRKGLMVHRLEMLTY